ncbi:MAG: hypothetical protein UHS49_01005 [Faecalimonas sp.]|nr:hypothetical protein [Faecalimonas sp.]
MRDRLRSVMWGRYGFDQFSRFLMGVELVLCILGFFVRSRILYTWWVLIFVYVYYRMFSRNIAKRQAENQKYLQLKAKVMNKFHSEKRMFKQRKTHHIYKCPTCRQKIRIPRGKGRICITCPKCKTEFTRTSY